MTRRDRIVVIGASGHGKVVADAALRAAQRVVGFADADPNKRDSEVLGIPVIATELDEAIELAHKSGASLALGVGSNAARSRIFARLLDAGVEIATIVHPAAVLAPSVRVGAGSVVLAGVVVNPDSRVGRNVILNTSASIDHDCNIGDHAHLSPGVHLGGTVTVGQGTHLGIGAVARNNITIGAWSVIGAGAAVLRDLPDRIMAYGVPARVIKEIEP